MFSSPIEEIKSKLNIVDVVSGYIKLTKAGANYKALCPFHGEKTPSLFVSPSRQMWHCFGCGEGHSMFDFVMKIEGIEFGDALRILANKAGVELKRIKPEFKTKRNRLYDICELAARFYQKQLGKSAKGKIAKQYLLNRKINEESIKEWRLGWAPEAWHSLCDFLSSQGYSREEVKKTGLAIQNKKGRYYDRFRSRVMFPIFDLNSQVIGFGGRVLKKQKELAKYMNTPNTLLYDKGKLLYGLNKARVEIRKKDSCVLVEGYVDVILAHQSPLNMKNVVATAGTALTPFHLSILKRYSNNLSLAFDMDFAGDAATKRGIDLAQRKGFNLRVVKMPDDKDPADVISVNYKKFEELANKSVSILDFYFQNAFSKFDEKTAEGKREISKLLLPVIKKVLNKIEQASWVQQLAQRLNVREKDVEIELKKVKLDKAPDVVIFEAKNPIIKKTKKQVLEERLLTLLLKSPQSLDVAMDKEAICYLSSQTQEIINNFQNKDKISEFSNVIDPLSLKAETEQIEEEEILPEIKFCLKEIQSVELKKKLDDISLQIRQAQQEQDAKKIENLNQQFNQLTKKIITN
jgi:DNA primase